MVNYMCIQACAVEIQPQMYWNMIGHCMTTTLPVLTPDSTLLSPSSLGSFISARIKFCALFKNVITSRFLLLLKNYSSLKSLKARREQLFCLGILTTTLTYFVQLRFTFRNIHILQCFQTIQNKTFQRRVIFFLIFHSI